MKKIIILATAILFSVIAGTAEHSNCPVAPFVNTITQPDGSRITLHPYGNEAVHYLETSEGYTVLQNSEGIFEYGIKGPDGNLISSGIRANDETAIIGKTAIPQHLRYSSLQVSLLMQYHSSLEEKLIMAKAGANVFPPTGTHKVMVLLIQFSDLKATIPASNFQQMFNQPNWNGTGSFTDYYLKTSYGKLNVSVDVYGWYNSSDSYLAYANKNHGSTTPLLQRAVWCADSAGVDFSQYDSDNDGYLDAVMVLHSGIGAEESSAPNNTDYIWSFRSSWYNSPSYNHSKKVYAYDMFPERRYYTGGMVGIGVMCHEFGHILDLPDLYATNYANEGVGDFANMAGGPWLNNEHTPCLHDAWSRIQLGWLTPTVISTQGTFTIKKCAADSNFAYQINTTKSNEYFLLENRQWKGNDRYLPSKGLAIWHINSNYAGKLSVYGGNSDNNDTSNMGVSILQADGRRDLENNINRGDNGDLYPGVNGNRNVTPYTNPSSALWYKSGGIRQTSGIYISGITQNSDSSVTFKFGAVASASFLPSNTIGCVPFTVNFNNTSVFASSFKWDFGDGSNSVNNNVSHTFTSTGTFQVSLQVYDSTGSVADTYTQTIEVQPFPKAKFNMVRIGNSITFTNQSVGATIFKWKIGTYTSSNNSLGTVDVTQIQDTGVLAVTLYSSNTGGCIDSTIQYIDIWKTGVRETLSVSGVKVFPNPFGDKTKITVECKNDSKISIFNTLGQLISMIDRESISSNGISNSAELNNELFPSKGIYFVCVEAEGYSTYVKIVYQ